MYYDHESRETYIRGTAETAQHGLQRKGLNLTLKPVHGITERCFANGGKNSG